MVICLGRGADCLHMVQLTPLHPTTPSSLASFHSRLVLSFWYRLTQVVLEKRPLNECCSIVVDSFANLEIAQVQQLNFTSCVRCRYQGR